MTIGKKDWADMLERAARMLREETERLSEIDSQFGDGDHGVTIGKISNVILEAVAQWEDESIRVFIEDLGDRIMAVNGGSAGPLYGTMIGGLAGPLGEETELDSDMVKKMLAASLEAMEEITKARVGDKTMMDALIPAVEAAQGVSGPPAEVLRAAALAAAAGAAASEGFASKFGRARSYKEQTIGTPDAGAVSTSVFFSGLTARQG